MKLVSLSCFLFLLIGCKQGTTVLSADPGQFEKAYLSKDGVESIEVKVELIELKSDKNWPASAYIGFNDRLDSDSNFQVVIIQNKPEDKYLVIGYRSYFKGKEAISQAFADVPLSEPIDVKVSFKSGVFNVIVNELKPIFVRTQLDLAIPYISVATATARFEY